MMKSEAIYYLDEKRWHWLMQDEQGRVLANSPSTGYSSRRNARRGFKNFIDRAKAGGIAEKDFEGRDIKAMLWFKAGDQ